MAKAKSSNKKGKQRNLQVNQYDKILWENIEGALPGLIRNLLGIHAVHTEELPDDIQHTKVIFRSTGTYGSCGYWHNCVT